MKVYLDNCVFNRPFDNQTDIIVRVEATAKLAIQQMIRVGQLELLWSNVLDYENNDNPFEERRFQISEWKILAIQNIVMNNTIIEMAGAYMKIGLRQKDATHLACAVYGGSDYFITVDKKILNKSIGGIVIVDPVAFLRRLHNAD